MPFSPQSPIFFSEGSVAEAIARINFLVESNRRLGLLVGPMGVGKTTLLQTFARGDRSIVRPTNIQPIYFSAIGQTETEMLKGLCRAFGDGLRSYGMVERRGEALADLWQRLSDLARASKNFERRWVVLADGFLDNEIGIQFIRRLVQMGESLSMVATSPSEGNAAIPRDLLCLGELRIELPAWDLGQTADYFDFALEQSGGRVNLFDAQAITRVHELSQGLPSAINRLADLALVAGAVQRVPRLSSDIIDQVYAEFSLEPWAQSRELMSPMSV
jgi:GTPase SAR1 family protein